VEDKDKIHGLAGCCRGSSRKKDAFRRQESARKK
jgi:hypothetical protein